MTVWLTVNRTMIVILYAYSSPQKRAKHLAVTNVFRNFVDRYHRFLKLLKSYGAYIHNDYFDVKERTLKDWSVKELD